MSSQLRIVNDPLASVAKREIVEEAIALHNVAATGADAHHPVALFLEADGGEVCGGVLGQLWGGWLQVDFLWVTHRLRGVGHGRALLEAAERYARERGAVGVHLSSFSFQAPGFYEELGYERFAVLEDCPEGHEHHYFKKRL